jgi:2-amino-4-hydroxy-6-hydroxymethyldihydropteridine diphosphokinase
VKRRPYEYLISVGSNVEPDRYVDLGLDLLRRRFRRVLASPRYDVGAVGDRSQPRFINLAVRLATDVGAPALRETCRLIEEACGRRREADRHAPRTMDLDVVFGAPNVPPDVDLPHPDLLEQAYVLVPCSDVWPEARHSVDGRSLRVLANTLFPGWAEPRRQSRPQHESES